MQKGGWIIGKNEEGMTMQLHYVHNGLYHGS